MHWVVQRNIFRPRNFESLTDALARLGISSTVVEIPTGTLALEPDIAPHARIYACGGNQMARISKQRGWSPGCFLDDHFNVGAWRAALGEALLNVEVEVEVISQVEPRAGRFFIRPLEDNKAFDGRVMDAEGLRDLQRQAAQWGRGALEVAISEVKEIFREYRVFIVRRKVITGSLYKVGGKPLASREVEEGVYDFARGIIEVWLPHESCVIDVALTPDGYKVIEFNNINSSGFYAIDVPKYVHAIQEAYA